MGNGGADSLALGGDPERLRQQPRGIIIPPEISSDTIEKLVVHDPVSVGVDAGGQGGVGWKR